MLTCACRAALLIVVASLLGGAGPVCAFAETTQPEPRGPEVDSPIPHAERPRLLIDADAFLTTQRGSLPIILSAPHGGTVRVPGSADRASGVLVRDLETAEIALLTYQRIVHRLDAEPWLVIAQFSRRDADANRAASQAYENARAEAVYDAYHAALDEAVREAVDRFGLAVVIDIHGQSAERQTIFRGTRNGGAVDDLLRVHGNDAIVGAESLFGALKERGYAIDPDPADGTLGREDRRFNGGYISAHYGTLIEGADAIQVELGRDLRTNAAKMGRDLGDAISDFAEAYLLD